MNITDFLLARIAEDEAMANDVAYYTAPHHGVIEIHLSRRDGDESHSKIVRPYDPARVLVECEIKRRIVERCVDPLGEPEFGPLSDVLCALASVYADHPDYRQEWTL